MLKNFRGDKDAIVQSGIQSEDLETEPLDRTKDVLEELQNKVLDKYPDEIAEIETADAKFFKLKA